MGLGKTLTTISFNLVITTTSCVQVTDFVRRDENKLCFILMKNVDKYVL